MGRMSDLEPVLRTLPAFPDELPMLDPEQLPDDPEELFRDWLGAAIDSGERQPHAMTFITVRPDGVPVGRTLIVKDIDGAGFHFSTHRSSRKGAELDAYPQASMLFFWRASGRQVRITGTVVALDEAISQRDWADRPSYTGSPNPDWQRYALVPSEYEFMQAQHDRKHPRIEYRRDGANAWSHGRVATPAG